jgi:hypothetical protein
MRRPEEMAVTKLSADLHLARSLLVADCAKVTVSAVLAGKGRDCR